MGIPAGPHYIDDTATFTVNTHDVATGASVDADSTPSYRVYEDETGTAILTGSMALLDSSNTAGFYSEQITLSAANGFEVGKSYSVYVSATVDGVAASQSYNFKVIANALTAAAVNAEVLDVLTVDTFAEPGQAAPPSTTSLLVRLQYLYKFLRNRVTQTSTTFSVYDDAGTTVDQKATTSDNGTTFERGEITSGP